MYQEYEDGSFDFDATLAPGKTAIQLANGEENTVQIKLIVEGRDAYGAFKLWRSRGAMITVTVVPMQRRLPAMAGENVGDPDDADLEGGDVRNGPVVLVGENWDQVIDEAVAKEIGKHNASASGVS